MAYMSICAIPNLCCIMLSANNWRFCAGPTIIIVDLLMEGNAWNMHVYYFKAHCCLTHQQHRCWNYCGCWYHHYSYSVSSSSFCSLLLLFC